MIGHVGLKPETVAQTFTEMVDVKNFKKITYC